MDFFGGNNIMEWKILLSGTNQHQIWLRAY